MSPRLSRDELASFETDGFVVLRGALDPAMAAAFRAHADRMGAAAQDILTTCAARGQTLAEHALVSQDALIVVPEADNPAQVCRFEYMLGHDPAFAGLVAKTIAPLISSAGGELYFPFKDKENEKHPGGGAFPPHQDFTSYKAFGPRYNITAMVTIDAATIANGCLEFAPGWRKALEGRDDLVALWEGGRPLLHSYRGGTNNGDIVEEAAALFDWRFVETRPADLVIFDSFAPHRSAPNFTSSARRAMFLTYNAAREGDWYGRYYGEKRQAYNDPKFHVSTPTRHIV